ncbi:MAG: SDR family NAD(P)-dependent oxidoreductase [Devosia sp.]|nr:SDR family NAD(P)-dependent oxidoreductase [Devosia sp.]
MPKKSSKVLFVTGAASGIGAAIARRAVERGDRVVLADINLAGAKAVASGLGDAALAVQLDITDPSAWESALDAAWARFGRVDVLINNAAVVHVGRAENVALAQHQQTLNVNFMGPLTGMLAILPRFQAEGRGQFVTVCSMTAFLPFPGLASYAAAKHALRAFHHGFAIEQRNSPFAFSIIHPTSTETPMLEQEAASDEAPLCFSSTSVTADYVAGVVLQAMDRKTIEVFMPPDRAKTVRLLGTNPRRLKAMVDQGEAIGAERLKARRAAAA